MSLCGICWAEIEDDLPKDENNLGYDKCEEDNIEWEYTGR